jgi:hypothetical protein
MAASSNVPPDTSSAAYRAQIDAYRRMGPRGRAEVVFRLNDLARSLATAGIKSRHPEYDEEHVRLAYARLVLGDEWVLRAWPGRALVAP